MEVAALGLKVEGVADIDRASTSLDKLVDSAGNADRASTSMAKGFGQITGILAEIARSVSPLSASFNALNRTVAEQSSSLGRLESALAGTAKGADSAAAAVSRESDALVDARKQIDALSKRVEAGETAAEKYGKQIETLDGRLKSKTRETEKASRSTDQFGAAIRRVAGVVATYLSAREIYQYADAWSDMTSLVRVNIGAQEDAGAVMERLGDIARGTYSSLELTAQGFARNAFILNALGKSTQQQLDYTEALNNALVVSGAKGQQAELVQNALGRAMAEGAAKGDDLNLVLNYGSRVAEVLADELGVNVTQLRSLAQEGKITGEVIFSALVRNMQALSEEAESMPATIGDAFILLRNSVLQAVGVYDQANGLSESLAENLIGIADAIRDTDWSPYINGLKLAASLVAAYMVATYGATAATWLFVASQAAAWKAIAAVSMSATIGAASLLSLKTNLAIVAAAFAGWQIGTYLREEFEVVEKAGIALMSGLHQAAVWLGGMFKVLGETVKFALTSPLSFVWGQIVDFIERIQGLGAGAAKALGFGDLAETIGRDLSGLRTTTDKEYRATITGISETTKKEMAGISAIYFDMFDEVGKSAKAAGAISEEALGGTKDELVELTEAQKALASAFDQTLSQYHRQINLAQDASEEERLLYEIQYGRLNGLLPEQQKMLQGMARELDLRERLRKIEEDQKGINRDRDSIARELLSEEEKILESYGRRRDIVMAATFENEQARTELLLRLERERNEQLLEVSGTYWQRWLLGAQESLTSFSELSGSVVENFQRGFGDAVESMVFDSETLSDAMKGLAENMLRSVVNALGQMAAQWLAYQAVQLLVSKATQSTGATSQIANAKAASAQAGLSAYASTAAIPIVGPALAPGAAAAATAATLPMVAAVSTAALAGIAHDGIDSVPREGTWLLDRGERVVDARTNADLKQYLGNARGSSSAGGVNIVVNLVEDQSRGGQVEQTERPDGSIGITAFVADIRRDGPASKAMSQAFGLKRRGK